MNFKKILASVLATSLVASAVSIGAFAATTLSLTASKTEVARGDEFTITLPMNADNTKSVQAVSAGLKYNDAKFDFVSAESDFVQLPAAVVNVTGGVVLMSNANVAGTTATGRVFEAKFRVKTDAIGGSEEFSVQSISISDAAGTFFGDSNDISAVSVEIKAPTQLATPAVTIDDDKKATWPAVPDAAEYNVSLLKNGTEILNRNQATCELDFASYVTETAKYDVIVKANQNGSLHLASEASASAAKAFLVEPTITPTTKEYVKGSGGFDVTMTLNGNTFDGIDGLTDGTDYTTKSNSVVHINESALTADTTLAFKFSNTVGLNVTDKTVTVTVKDAADAVTLVFAEREKTAGYADDDTVANDGTNDGLIVVTNGTQPVVNFLGAQFTVTNTADVNYDKVEYDIVPADGYVLLHDEETGMYEINVKPVNGVAPAVSENIAGEGIVIGKLVRKGTGYGKGTITAGNIVITVEKSDNSYKKIAGTNYSFLYDIPEPTEKLNVNVGFDKLPTEIKEKAYQKMSVTLYSARLGNIAIDLGEDAADYASEDGKITATVTDAENKFGIAFEGLPAFEAYTVSIKGDGYRDAKAQFVLNEETTVNFWNNAYESGQVFISKVGGEETLATTNFLAGDVIMNGVIDLYDLSAVSSYFGKKGLTKDTAQYIQYDLNRDGRVDITDITMLLAGWAQ